MLIVKSQVYEEWIFLSPNASLPYPNANVDLDYTLSLLNDCLDEICAPMTLNGRNSAKALL